MDNNTTINKDINIEKILSEISTLQKLKKNKTNCDLKQKCEYLYTKYPTAFNLICNDPSDINIKFLGKMLKNIKEINDGNKTKEDVEKMLGDDLADRYLKQFKK